jgi:hypothetical protein
MGENLFFLKIIVFLHSENISGPIAQLVRAPDS